MMMHVTYGAGVYLNRCPHLLAYSLRDVGLV